MYMHVIHRKDLEQVVILAVTSKCIDMHVVGLQKRQN